MGTPAPVDVSWAMGHSRANNAHEQLRGRFMGVSWNAHGTPMDARETGLFVPPNPTQPYPYPTNDRSPIKVALDL